MDAPPNHANFVDAQGNNDPAWTEFQSAVFRAIFQDSQFGTTAQRPTKNLRLWMCYGDQTLGKPIWLKTAKPIVWVDSTGAAV